MFNDLGKDFTWFQRHERIIIIAMVLAVAAFGLNKWLDKSVIDAASRAAVAQQVAAVQHDADVKVAAAIAQQTALFNHDQALREQEMASLVAAVASRDAASNNRVKVVTAPKSAQEAVVDLSTVYTLPVPVTVTSDGASVPTVDLQQFTATKIQLDTATADLTDTQKELDTATQGLASATSLVGALQTQVTGLQTETKTNDTACTAQIEVGEGEGTQE